MRNTTSSNKHFHFPQLSPMKHLFFSLLLATCASSSAFAQDDMLDGLEPTKDSAATEYVEATFKTVRLVNGHSTEVPYKKSLQMMIQHRFGELKGGAYELWGLDQAYMRIGFEYGFTNRLSAGFGRSTTQKTYDGHIKYKLLRQSTGKKNMPVTAVWISQITAASQKWAEPNRDNYFSSRLNYVHQLLISRKFNRNLSLQIMPTLVHRNLAPRGEASDQVSIGMGGRYKLSGSTALNVEYYPIIVGKTKNTYNSLSACLDIETGGHVFQITLSNTTALNDNLYLTNQLNGNWLKGGIHLGFNLMRVFNVGSHESSGEKW